MLEPADLEVNVLEFRQRSFQFARIVELPGGPIAVFERTETETERQLRPRLLHLTLLVPQPWVVLDPATDLLRVAASGAVEAPPAIAPVVEVAAEPEEFEEGGVRWRRVAGRSSEAFLYGPAERSAALFSADGRRALGLA
jgi:hypothetical protein